MIDPVELDDTIKKLELQEPSMHLCERLAWLYVVRDHIKPTMGDTSVTQRMTGSDFLEACSGVSYPMLMRILDEHMEAVKVVQPREYEKVMDAIRQMR